MGKSLSQAEIEASLDAEAHDEIAGAVARLRTKRKRSQAPWLTKLGEPLCSAEIKRRSRYWSLDTWERFVAYLDEQDSQTTESMVSPNRIEDELKDYTYELQLFEEPKIAPDYSDLLEAQASLDFVRRTVIQKIYFEGFSVRDTAQFLKCPSSTVQDLKSSALSMICEKIPDSSPLVRGKSEFLPRKERRKKVA